MFNQQQSKNNVQKKNGIALLLTIVVIGITGFSVMAYLAQSGILSIRSSQFQEAGAQTKTLLEGCIDEVIAQYMHDIDFNSNEVSLGANSCGIIVISEDDEEKIIELSVATSTITQSVEVTISPVPVSLVNIHW